MEKSVLFALALCVFPSAARAEDLSACLPLMSSAEEVAELKKMITAANCATQKLNTVDDSKVRELAAQFKDGKVVKVLATPTSRTSSSVTYKISPEQVLLPGQAMYFGVPPDLAQRPIRFAVLGHRQDQATEKGWNAEKKWDDVPGLTSVQFHSPDYPQDPWRYWRGDASGKLGSKFAEIRSEPEIENLYEWRKHGHGGVQTGNGTTDPLRADAIRLISTGQDQVLISEITMKVLPETPSRTIEHAFSKGTAFGNFETGKGQSYGGGQAFQGKFPGALALGGSNSGVSLPDGWKLEGSQLRIPLPEGISLTSLELAIGDTHPDGVKNSDGGWGTQGWARISAALKKKNGSTDVLMNRENVPPEGVLFGTPVDACYRTQAGDELVISGSSDVAYLMGLRLGLQEHGSSP